MQNSLSPKDVVYWIGIAAVAISAVVTISLGVWWRIRKGKESEWKDTAEAYEKRCQVLEREKIEMLAKLAEKDMAIMQVQVAYAQCQKSADERTTAYFQLTAAVEEYKRNEERYKQDIRYLEMLLGRKLPSSEVGPDR